MALAETGSVIRRKTGADSHNLLASVYSATLGEMCLMKFSDDKDVSTFRSWAKAIRLLAEPLPDSREKSEAFEWALAWDRRADATEDNGFLRELA